MFRCHLNLELYASRVGVTKYLFRYVYEENDRETVQLVRCQQHYDEVSLFQDARYASTSESLWRLFQLEIIKKFQK